MHETAEATHPRVQDDNTTIATGNHRVANPVQSISDTVVDYVERNPVIAAGAALAVGAAVAMVVQARRGASNRIDRRVQRAVRSMDKSLSREMRALRRSDVAGRVGEFGNALGDVISRIDLAPLAERGRLYLEAARRRMGA